MTYDETIDQAELALAGLERLKRQYNITDEMSLDKEANKRVMLYYAAPKPHRYGYFVSTNEAAREAWFRAIIDQATSKTKHLIWC